MLFPITFLFNTIHFQLYQNGVVAEITSYDLLMLFPISLIAANESVKITINLLFNKAVENSK